MKEEYRIFAKNLLLYMNHYGYRQTALAKQLSVAPATVAWWCQGERLPRFGKMRLLTELFDCTTDDLFSEETSAESILFKDKYKLLREACSGLNSEGIEKVIQYLKDLKPCYFKDGQTS